MEATEATSAPGDARREPRPAEVRGNRWTDIDVEEIGALTASATVSVVISGRGGPEELALTLASLTAQTYPAKLTEVLVERSTAAKASTAPRPGNAPPNPVGSADEAGGEVILLVEAGAILDPRLVEAHARWHHAVSDAVSIGPERAVDAAGITAEEVEGAARSDRLDALLGPRRAPGEAELAIEAYLERTRQLTERDPDLFWIASCGTVAVRRAIWAAAGGRSREPDDRLARLDLAWRLAQAGTVLVPEHAAVSHTTFRRLPLVPRGLLGEGGGGAGVPRAESLIPSPGYRRGGGPRRHRRPSMVVEIFAREEPSGEVLETVDDVLRGRFSDLELRLALPDSHPERPLVAAAVEHDPRVTLVDEKENESENRTEEVPLRVTLPLVAHPDERTFEDLNVLMREEEVGALHVTVPGEVPRNAMVEVVATGALARARRVAEVNGDPPEVVLGELFGERWISGVEVSLRRRGAAEPQVTEHGPLAPATDLEHERTQ
ncbi:MAG TPA: hypothetical protein VGR10_03095, partial [Thermoleophilaceae bacterium]|nr:hypothetical protein [Thermoleophilaceae bacterium]